MTSLDLLADDLESDTDRHPSFFDWTLRENAGLHTLHALRARYKRRVHLPAPDFARQRLWHENAPWRA